jgi:hypothetical protein
LALVVQDHAIFLIPTTEEEKWTDADGETERKSLATAVSRKLSFSLLSCARELRREGSLKLE